MARAHVYRTAIDGWASGWNPGEHVVVFGDEFDALEGRRAGLELRDTLAVFHLEGVRLALLFRAPCHEESVAAQALLTGTGALNVDACRVGSSKPWVKNRAFGAWRELERREDRQSPSQTYDPNTGRWPTNVALVHAPGCARGCVEECPISLLGAPSRYYPQFDSDDDLVEWLERLSSSG